MKIPGRMTGTLASPAGQEGSALGGGPLQKSWSCQLTTRREAELQVDRSLFLLLLPSKSLGCQQGLGPHPSTSRWSGHSSFLWFLSQQLQLLGKENSNS